MKVSIIDRKTKAVVLKISVRKAAQKIEFNFASANDHYHKLDERSYTVNQLLRMNKSMLTRFLTAISDDSFNALVKHVDKCFENGSYQSERHYNKFSEVVEFVVDGDKDQIEKYLASYEKLMKQYKSERNSETKTRAVFEYTA